MIATPTNSYVPSAPGAAGIASDRAMPLRKRTVWMGLRFNPTACRTVQATRSAVVVSTAVSPKNAAADRTWRSAPAPADSRRTSPVTVVATRVDASADLEIAIQPTAATTRPATPSSTAKRVRSCSAEALATTRLDRIARPEHRHAVGDALDQDRAEDREPGRLEGSRGEHGAGHVAETGRQHEVRGEPEGQVAEGQAVRRSDRGALDAEDQDVPAQRPEEQIHEHDQERGGETGRCGPPDRRGGLFEVHLATASRPGRPR